MVTAKRLSCTVACGIFLDQGSNSCPLHWQADSLPLDHQKSVNMNITSLKEEVEYWDSSVGMMMQKWQVASVCDLKSHGSWAATRLWGGPAKLQRKWVLKSLFLILKTLRDLLENSDRHWFHLELVGCSGCLNGYLETHTLSGICFFI